VKDASAKVEGNTKKLEETLAKSEKCVMDFKADRDHLKTNKKNLTYKISSLEDENKTLEEKNRNLDADHKALKKGLKSIRLKKYGIY